MTWWMISYLIGAVLTAAVGVGGWAISVVAALWEQKALDKRTGYGFRDMIEESQRNLVAIQRRKTMFARVAFTSPLWPLLVTGLVYRVLEAMMTDLRSGEHRDILARLKTPEPPKPPYWLDERELLHTPSSQGAADAAAKVEARDRATEATDQWLAKRRPMRFSAGGILRTQDHGRWLPDGHGGWIEDRALCEKPTPCPDGRSGT